MAAAGVRPGGKDSMTTRHSWAGAALLAMATVACQGKGGAPADNKGAAAELKTEDEKTLYALGLILGKNACGPLKPTEAELAIIVRGLSDAASGKTPAVPLETYGPKVQTFVQTRIAAAAQSACRR